MNEVGSVMKVLFTTNVPSPYRLDFFSELGKLCDLTVLFEKASSDERDSSWNEYKFQNYKGIILKGKTVGTDKAFCPSIVKYLNDVMYDAIIISNPITPTGMYAIMWLQLHGKEYYVEGDGAFPNNRKGIKEVIKKVLFRKANGCFSTAKIHDKYYESYGVKVEKIIRYPFSSIFASDILSRLPTCREKETLKNKLNIHEEKVVLSVGQMIKRKGFDILLEAWNMIDSSNMGLYIIGGKPTNEFVDIMNNYQLKNVHFIDFIKPIELKDYYRISDVFVLATREDIWGLVINEAMAEGLPIITTDRCIAGLELVQNGENGFIVKTEDPNELGDSIKLITTNKLLNENMRKKSLEIIKKYTIESMASRHIEVLSKSRGMLN